MTKDGNISLLPHWSKLKYLNNDWISMNFCAGICGCHFLVYDKISKI